MTQAPFFLDPTLHKVHTSWVHISFLCVSSCSIPKRVCQCGDQRSVANVLWQEGLGIKHQLVHFPSFGRFLDQSDLFRLVYAKKFDTWTKGFTFRSILLNMPTKPTKEWEHCILYTTSVVCTTRFCVKKNTFASHRETKYVLKKYQTSGRLSYFGALSGQCYQM